MDPRKLKVNELKEQLQLVGLSVNGKKEELVARLLEHQKAEEEAVNAGGPPTGAGDTFEWDESKFDVEYGHDLAPPSEPAPSDAAKSTTSVQAPKSSASLPTASSATEPKTAATTASTNNTKIANTPAASTTQSSDSNKSTSVAGSIQFQGATKDTETLKAEFEKRKNRAARFGIPLKEQDKAVERAARFGVPVSANVTASLARATGNTAPASPKSIPAKSGSVAAQIPADVLNKRRERFGIQEAASTSTTSTDAGAKKSSIVLDAAEEEKKRKRAAKFGLDSTETKKLKA
ncbi:hypothetical protein BGZ46_004149 [Entomortierella lignicola]|nr:hypothetical protein BGZ46_004149 [Entomortierella lignicola]